MKKKYIYPIIAILFLTIVTVGTTYSFFMAQASSQEELKGTSKNFEVIYTGGKIPLENMKIKPSSTKEGGLNTSVNIKVGTNSVLARGTIYINIKKMTSNLSNDGFIWEVYGSNGYYKKGTFSGYNDTDNNIVNIVENVPITYDDTEYTIYLWLDGNNPNIDNRIKDAEFDCYIGAKTENFTGTTIK
ncbi:MAG: hypothetical protein IJZ79_07290 [Bacilli bacterium]|nr:hypothetical protein [Bacilli bacterium]